MPCALYLYHTLTCLHDFTVPPHTNPPTTGISYYTELKDRTLPRYTAAVGLGFLASFSVFALMMAFGCVASSAGRLSLSL